MALWLDPGETLAESNEINNQSFSWGTVFISNDFSLERALATPPVSPLADGTRTTGGKAYNGKVLPAGPLSMRKVRLTSTPHGGRRLEMLDDPPSRPQLKAEETHRWTKTLSARQHVIFPTHTLKPMPRADRRAR